MAGSPDNKISRREFLILAGASAAGLGALACGFERRIPNRPALATPAPTQEPSPTQEAPTAVVFQNARELTSGEGTYALQGFPESVDPSIVLRAEGPDGYGNNFRSETLGNVGGNLIFAEPGVLLVGPDFPKAQVDAAGGSIEYLNEVNHGVVHGPTEYFNLPEGRFLVFSGGQFDLQIGKLNSPLYRVGVNGTDVHNWFVAIRGLHPDGSTPKDRNWTVKLDTANPGHVEWEDYPHGAYISEKHFLQRVATAHDGERNCGYEGCPGVSVLAIDANNGSYSVMRQPQKDAAWEFVASNWFKKT